MKSLHSLLLRPTITFGFILVIMCLSTLPSSAAIRQFHHVKRQGISDQAMYQKRAANAALELQLYHQRIESARKKTATVMGIPPEVGITIRKDLQTTSTIFYQDDMESGVNGWTGVGLWHQTTRQANSPTHSWWAGVDSSGTYNTGARVNDALFSPTIDLTTAAGPVKLLFTENYVTERGWDFCMVDVAVDGSPIWNHLRGGYGESPSGDSYGWQVSTLDLTPYAGHTINLRFVFDTGDSLLNNFPGWFVDNVVVFDQAGTIAGTIYYDKNQNGGRDTLEFGLPSWLVSFVGPITIAAQTNGSGIFTVPLPLGSYQVSEIVQPLWTETSSRITWSDTLSLPGQTITGNDFGDYRQGCIIQGMAFNDANRDSVYDDGEIPNAYHLIHLFRGGSSFDEYQPSDSTGQFTFFTLTSGQYTLRDELGFNWFSTYPTPQQYTINVPVNDTIMNGYLFGSYWVFGGSGIRGSVYNDVNRDSVREAAEPGLAGWRVDATTPGTLTISAVTDSAGNYELNGLIAGPHDLTLGYLPVHWRQSAPVGSSTIALDSLETVDSVGFGVYLLRTGSVSGMVFNDQNGNMVRDSGENVMGSLEFFLTGKERDEVRLINGSTIGDDSGRYSFSGLWAGTYQTRIPLTSHWRQTFPPFFQPQAVTLGDEQDLTGLDFGLRYDSTFSFGYRTFLPESIAFAKDHNGKAGKSEKAKPCFSEATFDLVAPSGGVNGLHVQFSQSVDSSAMTITHFSSSTHDSKFKNWVFQLSGGDTLADSEHVILFARGNAGKFLNMTYFWSVNNTPLGKGKKLPATGQGRLDYAMPNEINLLESMYFDGIGSQNGLTVGLAPGPHSVFHPKAADVWKSLYDVHHHNVHLGPARCIGLFAGSLKPIGPKAEVKTLPPGKGQNIMFAEALALKVNLVASDLGITPFGFGDLVFQGDSTNRYDGLHVREIAKSIDTSLSAFDPKHKIKIGKASAIVGGDTCLCDTNFFKTAFKTVRMIDSAFSGPIDTVSFARGLIFTPVRTLADVPYLHIDSSFSQIGSTLASRLKSYSQIPERFALFQNYPNPFNPATHISFTLPHASRVSLTIYNMLGQEVISLLNKQDMDEGGQEIVFNASSFASGVYFYRLVAEGMPDENGHATGSFTDVKKMILLK
ncbi:MAG TPA: T9SS type A sorting domain-containing protein [Bacteroidota bacterium]|nr:T9SS type A sorting domain-containing protein [Bacteroidota bacterium]